MPLGELTWKDVLTVVAPLLLLVGVITTAFVQRRSAREQNTTTLQVHADTAQVDAAKLNFSDKELEIRKEVWASEMAERIGSAAHTLLTDAEARITTALAEVQAYRAQVDALAATVGRLETTVADCERRCAAHEERSVILLAWAQDHGWGEP